MNTQFHFKLKVEKKRLYLVSLSNLAADFIETANVGKPCINVFAF